MVKSYTLAGAAAFVCFLLAVCAVLTTIHILHDISDFYNEAQGELVEFKDIANNVWDEMVFESTPEEMRQAEDIDREKRSYEENNEYQSESSSTTTTTSSTTTTTAAPTSASASERGEELGYDFGQDTGPPSSRPRRPMPPTMPRTIQVPGFRAPPPAATSTYRPPNGRNYDNYGREPASSRRPYPPYQPYQSSSTSAPFNVPNKTPYNPPTNPRSGSYNPPNYTQSPPNPSNTRVPFNPNYPQSATNAPNTPQPRQPSGGYDSDRQTPPTWPRVYNTRRPNGPGYPEDQVPTIPPTVPGSPQPGKPLPRELAPGQERVPPTQGRNPNRSQYPEDQLNPQQPLGPVPPSSGATTPFTPIDEIPTGRTGSRPGFGPQRPRFPSRQRSNPCDQCSSQPNTCPPGPPGPRGRPGPPGFPGQDGPRGLRGLNGGYSGVHPSSYDPIVGCIQCPVGPPGERGLDGPPGVPGEDGIDGEQGVNGNDGQPGAPGAPGYHGTNGVPGAPGKPGLPGRNGQACRSIPGPPGKPGIMGIPGRAGDPGIDGEHGQDGSPGIQGPPGRDGNPGVEGPQGVSAPGAPGTDGGYCPCPKRSSKYDFGEPGYGDEERRSQKPRPRDHSAETEEERLPSRSANYGDNSEYERQRRPTYESSGEAPQRKNRYEDDERGREQQPEYIPEHRRPPPQRQSSRYPEEYERRPQETRGSYENERPREYHEERPRTRQDEGHSSGYGGDQRTQLPHSDREPRYESDNTSPTRPRPLKKVEITRPSDRRYPAPRREGYEDEKTRPEENTRRYGTESEPPFEEEPVKEVHPPGFRRPKPQEERRERGPSEEESLPPVKQTDRFEGEKRKKNQPEYEDISKSEGEEEKGQEKHHRKPNKFQEKQWEEHRKSQELRNSREHGGQVPPEISPPMQQVKPREQEFQERQRDSTEEKAPAAPSTVHDNFQSSERRETPLPSEQIPYRRKTRFYRNHYYEKFLL